MCLGTFRFLTGTHLTDSVYEKCAYTECRPFLMASRVQIEWVFLVQINQRFHILIKFNQLLFYFLFPLVILVSAIFPPSFQNLVRIYLSQTGYIHQGERSQVFPSLQCFLLRKEWLCLSGSEGQRQVISDMPWPDSQRQGLSLCRGICSGCDEYHHKVNLK